MTEEAYLKYLDEETQKFLKIIGEIKMNLKLQNREEAIEEIEYASYLALKMSAILEDLQYEIKGGCGK